MVKSKEDWVDIQLNNYSRDKLETIEHLFMSLLQSCEQYRNNKESKGAQSVFNSAIDCSRLFIDNI